MRGVKHLLECRCILPTLVKTKNPPLHKFVVFSVVNDGDEVIDKFAQCNNCGIIHKVVGICRSEISKNEDAKNILSKSDVALSLPPDVKNILESYDADLPTYEYVQFMIATEAINEYTVLVAEDESDDIRSGKILKYTGRGKFAIEPFQTQVRIDNEQ